MGSKGGKRTNINDVVRPDDDQKQIFPPNVGPDILSSIESATEAENKAADEANVSEVEQTSKDYWGRGSQETDGAVPSELPDNDPLKLQPLRKPKGPPRHNI